MKAANSRTGSRSCRKKTISTPVDVARIDISPLLNCNEPKNFSPPCDLRTDTTTNPGVLLPKWSVRLLRNRFGQHQPLGRVEAAGVQEALEADIFRGHLREHGFDLEGGKVQEEL